MTFAEGLVRVLLKATLYLGLVPLAIVLDMYYDSVLPLTICQGHPGPGYWDCTLGRQVLPHETDVLGPVGVGL